VSGPFHASASVYDAIYDRIDYAGHAAAIDAAIRGNRLDARSLLDVACGTGRHLQLLSRHYDHVEGLDVDPAFVEIARERNPGVPVHLGDMTGFELGRHFDAVTCLFSSIGYAHTPERLQAAVASMAAHLTRGGVLVIEPWFAPEAWGWDQVRLTTVDLPDLKVARTTRSTAVEAGVSRVIFDYLVATPEGAEHFTEIHDLGLFGADDYLAAASAAGLEAVFDPEGPMGRGLLVARRPVTG
jgi:SAM-dependent methyltransferase